MKLKTKIKPSTPVDRDVHKCNVGQYMAFFLGGSLISLKTVKFPPKKRRAFIQKTYKK